MSERGPPPPDGDRDRGLAVIAVNVVPLGFAFALVCLRVWIRTRNVKDLGLDDCFIVLGMVRFHNDVGLASVERSKVTGVSDVRPRCNGMRSHPRTLRLWETLVLFDA